MMTFFFTLLAIGGLGLAEGQEPAKSEQDPLASLRHLAGRWEGTIDGRLGTGKGIREYEWILEEQYLLFRHASVRRPQEKSPEGDHHRELAVFSFDSERNKIVLREFMVEGVVNRYACDAMDGRIVCATEHVENGPGILARLALELDSPYAFTEIFEIAFPGDKELQHYFTNRWTRLPELP